MTDIILIGATRKARFVLDFLEQEGQASDVIGFVDRDFSLWNTTVAGKQVLGGLEFVMNAAHAKPLSFCICLSERFFQDRSAIASLLAARGLSSASLISNSADISPTALVTDGAILFPHVRVGMNAQIGTCVTAYTGALIEHDCVIASNVEIASRAVLAGGVRIESNVFIGINATILPNITVNAGAIIGAGAVVTKDVEKDTVVVGNPARVLHAPVR